jgi:hypothetical protein
MFKTGKTHMLKMVAKSALRVTFVLALSGVAVAQSPAPSPAEAAAKSKAPDESEAVRIRGLVEKADATGVVVQLSKGISIRVDIDALSPVYAAARLAVTDLKVGDSLGVRTQAATAAGEIMAATEVIIMPDDGALNPSGMTINGAFKALDKADDRPVLTVMEGSAERKAAITSETSVWRLRRASIADVKAGVAISILVARDGAGVAHTKRVLFGSPPAGAMLPL